MHRTVKYVLRITYVYDATVDGRSLLKKRSPLSVCACIITEWSTQLMLEYLFHASHYYPIKIKWESTEECAWPPEGQREP
mgnify:CR=1 FL=1